jgi:hypothetical protein
MKTIVFLQNAWSPLYAGGTWPRQSWIKALETSHSGQRLKTLIDDFNLCENTTPIVGATSSSVIKPDFTHVRQILSEKKPKVVIACGKQAEETLSKLWNGALLAVPHPSHRFLTNDLYLKAKTIIKQGLQSRIALRQRKGFVEEVAL